MNREACRIHGLGTYSPSVIRRRILEQSVAAYRKVGRLCRRGPQRETLQLHGRQG